MSEEMRQEQRGSREAEKKRPLNRFFVAIYYLVSAVAGILHPVTVIGRENLPEHGALLCPNHNSNWDPVLVALKVPVNYRLHIMAKKELFCNRVFDWVLRKLGAFPVDRGEGDIEAVKNALKAIKSGDNLLMFPEGTRVEHEGDLPAKGGVAVIGIRAGAVFVPCSWRGASAPSGGPGSSLARRTAPPTPAATVRRRRSRPSPTRCSAGPTPWGGRRREGPAGKERRLLLRRQARGGAGGEDGRGDRRLLDAGGPDPQLPCGGGSWPAGACGRPPTRRP